MKEACSLLVDKYVTWLRSRISVEDLNGICEITTPFLDRHNDHIQIYVKETDEGLILSDDGYTIANLHLSGFEITTDKRNSILHTTLNGFGVELRGDELITRTNLKDFSQHKHNLIQAILSVDDMYVMSPRTVVNLFKEDVKRYLDQHNIRFSEEIGFPGKSGLMHTFDFVIPKSRKKPERILKTLNNPTRQNMSLLIFSWLDTRENRPEHCVGYGIVNDVDRSVSDFRIDVLRKYEIKAVRWSEIYMYESELAA